MGLLGGSVSFEAVAGPVVGVAAEGGYFGDGLLFVVEPVADEGAADEASGPGDEYVHCVILAECWRYCSREPPRSYHWSMSGVCWRWSMFRYSLRMSVISYSPRAEGSRYWMYSQMASSKR